MSPSPRLRHLNRDAAFVYGGYFLRYASLIVLIPFYGRVLGPTGYGKVLAAMSLMSIVWMVVNFGFSPIGSRELASVGEDMEQRRRIYGRQILGRLLLVPAGLAVGAAGTACSTVLAADWRYGALATALGIVQAFNLSWFFQGIRQFRVSIAIEALAYPLNLLLVVAAVRGPEDGLNVLAALLASGLLCLAIAYRLAGRRIRLLNVPLPNVPLAAGWREIRNCSVMFVQAINPILMTSGTTYFLSILATPEAVSYYGAAERFVTLGLSLLGPAGQILMPTISNLYPHDRQQAFQLMRKGLRLELAYGVAVLVAGSLLSPYLLPLVLGAPFIGSVVIMQILVCMFPFSAFSHAVGSYLFLPLRQEKRLITAVSIGGASNLGLAVIAVQLWGGAGMAATRVLGEVVVAVLLAIFARRLLRRESARSVESGGEQPDGISGELGLQEQRGEA